MEGWRGREGWVTFYAKIPNIAYLLKLQHGGMLPREAQIPLNRSVRVSGGLLQTSQAGYTFTYPLCGIFYFPWHRHHIEGNTVF